MSISIKGTSNICYLAYYVHDIFIFMSAFEYFWVLFPAFVPMLAFLDDVHTIHHWILFNLAGGRFPFTQVNVN